MVTTERSRHEHSLLELCGRIHGAYTGSGDGIAQEEAEGLRDWLAWRLNVGWHATTHPSARAFDNALYPLCKAAQAELESYTCWMGELP